jgi:hypothetical protein
MDSNEKTKMIGITPSLDEQTKINYISEVYHTSCSRVIKTLMYNKITLNEFYERAKGYAAKYSEGTSGTEEISIDGIIIF